MINFSFSFVRSTLAISIFFLMAACSEEEVTPTFEGTWTVYETGSIECANSAANYKETEECTSTDCSKITFNDDGTIIWARLINGTNNDLEGTYEVSGKNIIICFTLSNGEECETATYEFKDGNLIFYFPDSGDCLSVTKLKKD